MKEPKITEEVIKIEKHDDFVMVHLEIDDKLINTGENPIESYSFWEKMEGQVQRALHKIETKNPKMGFDFNFSTMGMSKEEKLKARKKGVLKHIAEQYPTVNGEKIYEIIDTEIAKIKYSGPDDNHPNPYMKIPISGDLIKSLFASCIEQYISHIEK